MITSAVIWTDGACSTDTKVGGWAMAGIAIIDDIPQIVDEGASRKDTTNNEMELIAFYNAVLYAYKNKIKHLTVYADSSYVVNAIYVGWLRKWSKNGWKTTEGKDIKNMSIWQKLYKLCYERGIEVTAMKVKGHANDVMNGYVDMKAVEFKSGA